MKTILLILTILPITLLAQNSLESGRYRRIYDALSISQQIDSLRFDQAVKTASPPRSFVGGEAPRVTYSFREQSKSTDTANYNRIINKANYSNYSPKTVRDTVDKYLPVRIKNGFQEYTRQSYAPVISIADPIPSPIPTLNLAADNEGQEAVATFGVVMKELSLSAIVKQPFEKKPSEITPLSLDGLASGTSAVIGAQWRGVKIKGIADVQAAFDTARLNFYIRTVRSEVTILCDQIIQKTKGDSIEYFYRATNSGYLIKIDFWIRDGCCCCDSTRKSLTVYLPKSKETLTLDDYLEISTIAFADLDSLARSEFFDDAVKKNKWVLSLSSGFAKNDIPFIETNTSTEVLKSSYTNKDFKIAASRIFYETDEKRASVLFLSAAYSKSRSAELTEYSFQIDSTNITRYTKEVAVGRPKTIENLRFTVEWRKKYEFDRKNFRFLAISPSVSYLTESKAISFACPIYLLQQKKNNKIVGIQGGIKIGYLKKLDGGLGAELNEGFAAGVFISTPFDLFKF